LRYVIAPTVRGKPQNDRFASGNGTQRDPELGCLCESGRGLRDFQTRQPMSNTELMRCVAVTSFEAFPMEQDIMADQQKRDAIEFWQNVRRLRQECLSKQ
jgi:hypothetical protein